MVISVMRQGSSWTRRSVGQVALSTAWARSAGAQSVDHRVTGAVVRGEGVALDRHADAGASVSLAGQRGSPSAAAG